VGGGEVRTGRLAVRPPPATGIAVAVAVVRCDSDEEGGGDRYR
jgi:hypothetical protein